jgi:hypothetical protein
LAAKVALDFLERKSTKLPCAGNFNLGLSFYLCRFLESKRRKELQRC